MVPIFVILERESIQEDQQDDQKYAQVEDWSKVRDSWFLLQMKKLLFQDGQQYAKVKFHPILLGGKQLIVRLHLQWFNHRNIFLISSNGWHPHVIA